MLLASNSPWDPWGDTVPDSSLVTANYSNVAVTSKSMHSDECSIINLSIYSVANIVCYPTTTPQATCCHIPACVYSGTCMDPWVSLSAAKYMR